MRNSWAGPPGLPGNRTEGPPEARPPIATRGPKGKKARCNKHERPSYSAPSGLEVDLAESFDNLWSNPSPDLLGNSAASPGRMVSRNYECLRVLTSF